MNNSNTLQCILLICDCVFCRHHDGQSETNTSRPTGVLPHHELCCRVSRSVGTRRRSLLPFLSTGIRWSWLPILSICTVLPIFEAHREHLTYAQTSLKHGPGRNCSKHKTCDMAVTILY